MDNRGCRHRRYGRRPVPVASPTSTSAQSSSSTGFETRRHSFPQATHEKHSYFDCLFSDRIRLLRSGGIGLLSVAVGDFNGDGVQDLAVANFGSDNVSILLGYGDGDFQAPRNLLTGLYPRSVAVGDFNGDGVLDLAAANAGYDVCVEYSKK